MPKLTLVGQHIRFATKRNGIYTDKKLFVIEEFEEDNTRYYTVQDEAGKKSTLLAEKADELFLIEKKDIKGKHFKTAIQNKSQIDYKIP